MAVQTQGLVSDADRLSQSLHQQIDRTTKTWTMLLSVIVIFFGLFLLFGYMFTYRRIIDAITSLMNGTAVIGSGNLDFLLEEKRNDEIGELARAFNRMTADLKTVTASKADLEKEIIRHKQTQEDLAASEKKYRELIETANSIIIRRDNKGVIRFINDYGLRFFGYSKEELIDRDIMTIMPDVEKSIGRNLDSLVEDIVKNPEKHTYLPSANIRKDGRTVWIVWTNKAIINEQGEVLEILSIGNDITQLKETERALRRSEERWNAAIDNFGEGAIIATEDEQVIYWNPAARTLHGFISDNEGIGPLEETPKTFELRTPDGKYLLDLDEWPMRRIKRGETVQNMELRLRRPDQGWEKIISYSGAMVETMNGERLIFLSVYDLSELRQAERALREALAKAE